MQGAVTLAEDAIGRIATAVRRGLRRAWVIVGRALIGIKPRGRKIAKERQLAAQFWVGAAISVDQLTT
jgi:hypothetical protein